MNFTDAVRKSMRRYMDGKLDMKALREVTEGDIIYTPDYFDQLEEAMLEDQPKGKKAKKKDDTNED